MDGTSILVLTATAAAAALGIAALVRSRGRASLIWFGLGALAVAGWLFAAGSLRVSQTAGSAVARAKAAGALAAVLPIPWTALVLVAARQNGSRLLKRWIPYLAALCAAGAFFAVRSLAGAGVFGVARARDGYAIVLDAHGRAMVVYLIASLVVILFNLEVTVRSARELALSRLKHAAIGLGAAIAFHLFVLSASLLYSTVRVSFLVAGAVPVLVAAGLVWYSVGRRRLSDVSVRVGRPVFYASLTALATGAYLLAMGVVGIVIRQRGWPVSTVSIASGVFIALLLLTLFLTSSRVKRHVRRFIDSNFYLSRYDYRREWARASRTVGAGVDEEEMADEVRALVTDALDAKAVEIALVGCAAADGGAVAGAGPAPPPRVAAAGGRPLAPALLEALSDPEFLGVLAERRAAVRIGGVCDPELASWAQRHRGAAAGAGYEVAAPLLAGTDLVGVALVGAGTGSGVTGEGLDLLTNIGLHAGNALLAARLASRLAERRELDSLNRVSAFIVHDLKNCVAGLSLLLTNARASMSDPAFQRDCLAALAESIAKMERIIARVGSAPSSRPSLERVFLSDAVSEAARRTGLARGDAPVRLSVSVPEGLAVEADRRDVTTVIENLLLNARDAVGESGEIGVEAERGGNGVVVVRVSDSGPGIAPGLMDAGQLFRPFRTTKDKGLGLGLFQCRAIVEALGGRITAANRERGAVFEFTIPAA